MRRLLTISFLLCISMVSVAQQKRPGMSTIQIDLAGFSMQDKVGAGITIEGQKFFREDARGASLGYSFVKGFGPISYQKLVFKYYGTLLKDPGDTRAKSSSKRGLLFFGIGPGAYAKVTEVFSVNPGAEARVEVRFKNSKKKKNKVITVLGLGTDFTVDLKRNKNRELFYFVYLGGRFIISQKKKW